MYYVIQFVYFETLTNYLGWASADLCLTLLVRGGADSAPPLLNIALNQVIWGPGPPKLIDFS